VSGKESVNNVLPGESGGDTKWFNRLNEFEKQETLRQIQFKRKRWPNLPNGATANHPNRLYPHILPSDSSHQMALFDGFSEDAIAYFENEDIAIHTEMLNLRSSQAACINFLYPLRQNLQLAASILKPFFSNLVVVTEVVFEYTGPEAITSWLGEPRVGKRGQNRTSIDTAVFWTDVQKKSHYTLIEWKYTERNFGGCSAFTDTDETKKKVCTSLIVADDASPEKSCMLTQGGDRRSRRYWEHLEESGVSLKAFEKVQGCPFQGAFYQLMRQHLVAHYLRKNVCCRRSRYCVYRIFRE